MIPFIEEPFVADVLGGRQGGQQIDLGTVV